MERPPFAAGLNTTISCALKQFEYGMPVAKVCCTMIISLSVFRRLKSTVTSEAGGNETSILTAQGMSASPILHVPLRTRVPGCAFPSTQGKNFTSTASSHSFMYLVTGQWSTSTFENHSANFSKSTFSTTPAIKGSSVGLSGAGSWATALKKVTLGCAITWLGLPPKLRARLPFCSLAPTSSAKACAASTLGRLASSLCDAVRGGSSTHIFQAFSNQTISSLMPSCTCNGDWGNFARQTDTVSGPLSP
mmetsp:Transcript_29942/g.79807  ORF Transcript_29942/g.79807 Transcript_29942/m.79807 type:complete len:248 (-) Transcript_29942:753-1496(-)